MTGVTVSVGICVGAAVTVGLGVNVFGSQLNFNTWMETTNISLGGVMPKSFLDSTFGIGLVKDALWRLEHGINA